jgi:hypothetical protein
MLHVSGGLCDGCDEQKVKVLAGPQIGRAAGQQVRARAFQEGERQVHPTLPRMDTSSQPCRTEPRRRWERGDHRAFPCRASLRAANRGITCESRQRLEII